MAVDHQWSVHAINSCWEEYYVAQTASLRLGDCGLDGWGVIYQPSASGAKALNINPRIHSETPKHDCPLRMSRRQADDQSSITAGRTRIVSASGSGRRTKTLLCHPL